MASEQIIRGIYGQCMGYDGDDDEPRDAATPAVYFAGDVREFSSCNASRRTSRLSLESEGDDADAEVSEEEDVPKDGGGGALLEESDKDSSLGVGVASMPGTPDGPRLSLLFNLRSQQLRWVSEKNKVYPLVSIPKPLTQS